MARKGGIEFTGAIYHVLDRGDRREPIGQGERESQTDPFSVPPIGFAGDPGNLYRYCGNNPANKSDPGGLIWGEFAGAAVAVPAGVGGFVGGAAYGLGNQIYSAFSGNGFSIGEVGYDAAVGGASFALVGYAFGTVVSNDPVAMGEDTVIIPAGAGLLGSLIEHHAPRPGKKTAPPAAPKSAPTPTSGGNGDGPLLTYGGSPTDGFDPEGFLPIPPRAPGDDSPPPGVVDVGPVVAMPAPDQDESHSQ